MKAFKTLTLRTVAAGALAGLLAACATPTFTTVPVVPSAETTPMPSTEDAADDPAIWLADGQALVLGTDKQTGLYVFDLSGQEVQALPIGPLNNVDLRYGAAGLDYAVASNDEKNVVSVFSLDRASGAVKHIGDFPTGMVEPYGICMGNAGEAFATAVTYKDGTTQIFTFDPAVEGFAPALQRTVKLGTQLEGCVFDEAANTLFIGEEAAGVWKVDLGTPDSAPVEVDMIYDRNGLAADVEGVSLWRGADGEGWLVVSAQGRNRYVVYDRKAPHAPRGVFEITDLVGADGNVIVDRTSVTDGLDVVSARVSDDYPRGLLVVQDDSNTDPAATQNFKYVDWRAVEAALGLPELSPGE